MKAIQALILSTALVLAAASPAVLAQPHGGGFGGRQMAELLDDVGASDAQRQQIEAIFKAAREELRGQMQEGRAQRQQMMKLWAAPNIDAAGMEALRRQQLQAHDRSSARMQQAFIDAGRVLTPEQRTKLAERMGKRAQRMHERMKKHGDHA